MAATPATIAALLRGMTDAQLRYQWEAAGRHDDDAHQALVRREQARRRRARRDGTSD